jgi:hypothetical protein
VKLEFDVFSVARSYQHRTTVSSSLTHPKFSKVQCLLAVQSLFSFLEKCNHLFIVGCQDSRDLWLLLTTKRKWVFC